MFDSYTPFLDTPTSQTDRCKSLQSSTLCGDRPWPACLVLRSNGRLEVLPQNHPNPHLFQPSNLSPPIPQKYPPALSDFGESRLKPRPLHLMQGLYLLMQRLICFPGRRPAGHGDQLVEDLKTKCLPRDFSRGAYNYGEFYGIIMEFPWDFYGIYMEFLWNFHGISMEILWDFYGSTIKNWWIMIWIRPTYDENHLYIEFIHW